MAFLDAFKSTKVGNYILSKFSWQSAFSGDAGELVSTYFTSVKILTENFSKLTATVRDEDDNIVEGHPLNKLLSHRPNPYQNRQKYSAQVEANRCNKGNGYVWVERNTVTARILRLHPLPSNAILGANIKSNGELYYNIDFNLCPLIAKVGNTSINSSDILHYNFAANDTLFSYAPTDIIGKHTEVMAKATQMIDSFYANNATSALAVETTIDKASMANIVNDSAAKFIDKYTGVVNAGKPIHLPPNVKLTPINQNFGDAQVIETQRFYREEIASFFGIPKFMFQVTDTDQSIEQQTRQFLAFTINPIVEIYVAEMEYKLLTAQEINKGYHIVYDTEKLIETDIKTKTDITALQVAKGLMTINEGTKAMGNAPVEGKFGDLHYIQSQNNPIEYYDQWGNNNLGDSTEKKETNEDEPKIEEDEGNS